MSVDPLNPRAVRALLVAALDHLDVVRPTALRAPIENILRAKIELCGRLAAADRSMLGRPVMYDIELAEALLDAADRREFRYNPKP